MKFGDIAILAALGFTAYIIYKVDKALTSDSSESGPNTLTAKIKELTGENPVLPLSSFQVAEWIAAAIGGSTAIEAEAYYKPSVGAGVR